MSQNIGNIMKQAKKLQERMATLQAELEMKTVTTTSNNRASKLPHPYSSQWIFFAGEGGTEEVGGGPGGDEVFGDIGKKVSLVNVWSGGPFP